MRIGYRQSREAVFNGNCQGFSMVELLITVAIFTMLSGALFSTLTVGDRSWVNNRAKIEIQQDLRNAMGWLREDLLQTGSAGITNVPADGTSYTTITFYKANGVSCTSLSWDTSAIVLSKGGTNSTQLLRTYGTGSAKVLANNISTFSLKRQASTPDILEVTLTGRKSSSKGGTITSDLSFNVQLRN